MDHPEGPALSVVVVTRDRYRTLRPIVAALQRQTIAGTLEVVVVAPDRARGAIPTGEAAPFLSSQVVPVGPIVNRGLAAAGGVRAARAPIVALSENHCFPEPDWAARTLEAHQGPWAGVGPAVENANPESCLSLALHAAGYGMFQRTEPVERRRELPLHNSSYRTELLLRFGTDLENLLSDERRLQAALLEKGQAFLFDPRIVKWHINEATWPLIAGLGYAGGRRYGGTRAKDWPLWKRLGYALAFPLLSVPIALEVRSKLPRDGSGRHREPWLSLVVWIYACTHATGEAASYLGAPAAEFPFVEEDEFLIRERLGDRDLHHPDVAALVSLLDQPVETPPARVP